MTVEDYRRLLPHSGEDQTHYALRLQTCGHEEMFIRKALRHHFQMCTGEFPAFFEMFEQARLRHLDLLFRVHPNRTNHSLARKLRKNLGITSDLANDLVLRFRASTSQSCE